MKFYTIYCNDSDSFLGEYSERDGAIYWAYLSGAFIGSSLEWKKYKDNIDKTAQFRSVEQARVAAEKISEGFLSNGFGVNFDIYEVELSEREIKIGGKVTSSEQVSRILSREPLAKIVRSVRDVPRSAVCQVIFDRIQECHNTHSLYLDREEDVANLAKAIEAALTDEKLI